MANIVGAPLTAITASLLFFGTQIGELQTLSWDENNNYRRVSGIGSGIDIIHVPGVAQYNLSARRALIEADLIADLLYTVKQGDFADKVPFVGVGPGTTSSTALTDASVTAEDLVAAILSGGGSIDVGDKIVNLYFDVQVQNAAGAPLFTFEDCSLNTRRANLDVSGVIIMSDITMMARKRRVATDTNRAAELQNALPS
jgi:hypothetical protein